MSTREVLLEGASPWGFRMTGGADVALSLRISRVNPGSKAAAKGVREGDLITSINKQPTKSLTNAESHALLRTVKENLLLGLNQDPDASPKRKGQRDRHHTPVEALPQQIPANDQNNGKGEKKTTSKLRRERRGKLKTKIKSIFGLGRKNDEISDQENWERSTEGSERSELSQATRNDDVLSDVTSSKLSEDNASLFYDNESTNEPIEKSFETSQERFQETSQERINSHSDLRVIQQNIDEKHNCDYPVGKDKKDNSNYGEVLITCSEYLMGKGRNGQELETVPPDIILSSNSQNKNVTETVVIKQVIERQIVYSDENKSLNNSTKINTSAKKPNDLNNNKSGDKRREAAGSSDNVSGKRAHVFHSADEYKIDETAEPDNVDRKQTGESVECMPERTVNLCKAIVTFEDGGNRNVEAKGNLDRPYIVLEDDASLILNSRSNSADDKKDQVLTEESAKGAQVPMYYVPLRRHLDVIKEEPSDISSDSEKTKDSSSSLKLINEIKFVDEWLPGGIDTSWRDGKSLDDVSDVPVASDSYSDTDLLVDDAKPPKYVPPNDKIRNKANSYQSNSKQSVNKNKLPSVNVVKSVVASYYNTKSQAVTVDSIKNVCDQPKESIQIYPSLKESPSIDEDIEIVYIDSSDSDALSISDQNLNSTASNRSSLELLEGEFVDDISTKIDRNLDILNNKNHNKISTFSESFKDNSEHGLSKTQENITKDNYDEEIIELSHAIITDIAETLSSGANSRVTSARSTPCRFFSPRSTPSMEVSKRVVGSVESLKCVDRFEECNVSYDNSTPSSASTTRMVKPVQPLTKLSVDAVLDMPNGRSVLKELGLDPRFGYDSGSDYCPETTEYSETSRLSFTSTDEIYGGARSHSDGTHLETDPDRPVSSCASSIVFITGPGKATSEPWIGLPLNEDPRFVICFSPSQLSKNPIKLDQQKASELFDLHKKFIHRRGYHESLELTNREPDLISIDASDEKDRCYAPEILLEAANMLALQDFREKRVGKARASETTDDAEDNGTIQDKELKLGCSVVDRKGGKNIGADEEVGCSRLLELIQREEAKSSKSPERIMLVEKATSESCRTDGTEFDSDLYSISKRGDIAIRKIKKTEEDIDKARPKSLPPNGEVFRRIMYEEYMNKVAERMERRQMKVIKVSDSPSTTELSSEKAGHLEAEFMNKVRERMEKLGLKEDENDETDETQEDKDTTTDHLPKHLQELVEILNEEESGVWSPSGTPEVERKRLSFSSEDSSRKEEKSSKKGEEESGSAVWTPRSAGTSPQLDRKKYRPINFQSPPPQRKHPPTKQEDVELPKDLPVSIVSSRSEGSTLSKQNSKLPPAQNPVITLLQKAREGQLPKGAQYLDELETSTKKTSESIIGQHEVLYTVKKEYIEKESESEEKKKVVELSPRKFEGIGPTTKEGTPIALRSEVKEDNQQRWYKRMYDSLHKADSDNLLPYAGWSSGYLSEPDRLNYDSDVSFSSKYATLDRRRARSTRDTSSLHSDYISTLPRSSRYSDGVRHAVNIYRNQPGRIEDYEPGHSSIADKEKQQWLEEVMDIFDGEFKFHSRSDSSAPPLISGSSGKSFTSVFKEGGYDSDSTLIFKRREGADLSPEDPKMAYKIIQRGGDVPLHGLRKPAPNKPKEPARPRNYVPVYSPSPESGREYIESEVNIHYKTPVRVEQKEYIEEGELARRQAEALRRIYQQQRRNKYLAELNDIHSRRHLDYFTPSQKSPIPLNRYDDFPIEVAPPRPRDRTPEPKLVARALYNFLGQSSRELSFRRGDIIFVRRQIDKNWYEGEHNAMIGLFPINYVEIIPYDGIRTLPKKSTEGQARAKFNFQAQTHLELSLVKGELVLLTRRVDENWFEGRIGNKKGIFPVSYVQVLVEPGEVPYGGGKPVVAPASHSVMLNGAKDIGSQMQPPRPPSVGSPTMPKESSQISQLLHIDSRADPVPYRAMYNYKPQNDDELELREGDVVYVMEKCDDGWYVGSLHRNGQFGTFPGNYVQRIP